MADFDGKVILVTGGATGLGAAIALGAARRAAKAVIRSPRGRHLCYCLTPMRYAWDQFDAYFGPDRVGRIPSAVMRRLMARLARWDRDTACASIVDKPPTPATTTATR